MSEVITTNDDNNSDYIKKRLNKILETRLDTDKETLDALTDLSTFFTENTLQTRRNLRSQIEKRSLLINENFLNAFRQVNTIVTDICDGINEMAISVVQMKSDLQQTQNQTSELIQQTNSLQSEQNKLQLHQGISDGFLKRFQLTTDEHQHLMGAMRDTPITEQFFLVLERIQSIHNDCRVLLQCGYETVALEIMEEMTLYQEGALERLYRWTQNHCRNIDTGTNDTVQLIMNSMNKLQDRPVLFKYIIDEYATARRAVLVRNFIDALTIGSSGGVSTMNNKNMSTIHFNNHTTKPIEMHANDPKRYIGDMFAWLHEAIPSEKDNLLLLLKKCDKNDLTEQIQLALAHISDGVCHPLKIRIETILSTEKDLIYLYGISNLIRFYQNIINKNIVGGGQLEECLAELQRISEQSYLNALQLQLRMLLQGPPGSNAQIILEPPQNDLQPPQSIGKLLNILKELLSVANMVENRQQDITKIVSCVIDPLLQSITESASHLPTIDMAVYLLNCLYQIQSTLTMYEYMDERMERLNAQSDAQIDTLTSEQASSLVANLNLGPIYTILQSQTNKIDWNLLKKFDEKLSTFLEMPDILLLPQINLLQSTAFRMTIQKRSFNVIIAIYKQLYERVHETPTTTTATTTSTTATTTTTTTTTATAESPNYQHSDMVFNKTPELIAEILLSGIGGNP